MQQLSSALILGLAGKTVHSFSPVIYSRAISIHQIQKTSRLFSMPDDPYPSDYDADDLESPEKSVSVDTAEEDVSIRDELKRELVLLAAVTNRGTSASAEEENLVAELVTELEALNPTADPGLNSQGDWELCYSSTQSFRSSPFFLAVRAFLGDDNKAVADNAFDIHDKATSASRVGKVRQIIDKNNQELVSEYELNVGLMPGLPVRVKGTVVTSADLTAIAPETWEMKVRGTKVNGSNVPFLDQFLDDNAVEIPVGEAYKIIGGTIPTIVLKTFYVDEGMRITRDVDDNFFVFTRA